MAGTVNSPSLEMEWKVTTRQEKIAASRGDCKSIYVRKRSNMLRSKGILFGCLEERGASLEAPSRMDLSSLGLTAQGWLCRTCQARIPATKLDTDEPEYAPTQLAMNGETRG
jgi:hypothetical protein